MVTQWRQHVQERDDDMAPLAAAIEGLAHALGSVGGQLERAATYAARAEWRAILSAIPDPSRLEHFGWKACSQNDEDGMLAELLRRLQVGPEDGLFVELGVGDGLENNTHYLLRQGYRGAWFEARADGAAAIRARFQPYLDAGQLAVHERFVTAEEIDRDLALLLPSRDVAVLSIDIDGNDYWVWQAIASIAPLAVIIEYNGKWPPPLALVQPYARDFAWDGSDFFGASLSALTALGARKGYTLVGCNVTGVNAFFVRDDRIGDQFPYAHTADHLYQPPRYELTWDCFARVGHRPSAGRYQRL